MISSNLNYNQIFKNTGCLVMLEIKYLLQIQNLFAQNQISHCPIINNNEMDLYKKEDSGRNI